MPAAENPRFAAFISYRHVEPDRTWAKWLHRAIETYRIPRRLLRDGDRRRTIGRVFRDEEELSASSDLSARIDEALRASEFLIVVCSPRTPASAWCNREIERFREMGRGDRILAMLIEGEPNESFPPALCEIRQSIVRDDGTRLEQISQIEPLAADVRPISGDSGGHVRRAAKLRIISTMLGVRYDDLVNREQQRRVQRMAAAATLATVLMLAMAALAGFAVLQRIDAVNQRKVAEFQRNEAERRRAEAQAVTDFLTDDVLAEFNPSRMPLAEARDIMTKMVIDPAAAEVEKRFQSQPLIEAAVHNILCLTYCRLGRADLALPHGQRSVEIRQRDLPANHPDTLRAKFNLGWAQELAGKTELAEAIYKEVMLAEQAIGRDRREAIAAQNQYAGLVHSLQRSAEAEPISRDALERARRVLGEDSILTLNIASSYAGILTALGRTQESIPLFRDVLERTRRVLGENNPDTITATTHVGLALLLEQKLDEAAPLFKDALERSEQVLGRDHPVSMSAAVTYAGVLAAQGHTDQANELYVDAINRMIDDPTLGENHPDTRLALEQYMRFLRSTGQDAEADRIARDFTFSPPATLPATQPTTGGSGG